MSSFCCFKQKTAYEMRISDWSSDVCSSDLGSVSNPSNGDRMMQASLHGTPTAEHCATISVAIELSMMSWVAVIHSPDRDRLSRHKLAAGDVAGLLAQIAKVRARVSTALGCAPAGVRPDERRVGTECVRAG